MLTVAFAIALLIAGGELNDAIRDIVSIEFYSARHDDLSVGFRIPRPEDTRYDLSRMQGVIRVEGSRIVPVDLSIGSRTKRLAIQGLGREGMLRQLVDYKHIIHPIPIRGIALTSYLAKELHTTIGDTVTINVLEGHQRTAHLVIEDTIDEMLGISAYMDIDRMGALTGEDRDYSEAMLAIDTRFGKAIQHSLENMPFVTGVTSRTGMIKDYQTTLADSMLTLNLVFILFASVLAFGVVYNSGRITLSERGREFASLRVLGFTKREVSMIMIGQQTAIVLLGMPIGFVIGYMLNISLARAYATELFRLPFEFSTQSLGYAAIVVLSAAVFSNIFIIKRIYNLDIIEVLKTRE
jgi:putative ABC transport system permease protein